MRYLDEYRDPELARRLLAELRTTVTRPWTTGAMSVRENPECIAGEILRGTKLPTDCTAYGFRCTPRAPLGAPMVSSEGTCAAFYNAGRRLSIMEAR